MFIKPSAHLFADLGNFIPSEQGCKKCFSLFQIKKKKVKKKGEKVWHLPDTYLQLQIIDKWKRTHRKWELSANTVAFISCRSRLTIMLAGATRWRGEVGEAEWGYHMLILGDVRIKVWVGMQFQISSRKVGVASGSLCMIAWTSNSVKQADGIGCGWVPVGQNWLL